MLDIDHFKSVNDTYGHDVGDAVLVKFSEIISQTIRENDVVGRWGGEEFLLICPETYIKQSSELAELLRTRIENSDFPIVGRKTASFGVAAYKEEESITELLKQADNALYQAKENGRNQVISY